MQTQKTIVTPPQAYFVVQHKSDRSNFLAHRYSLALLILVTQK